MRVYPSTNNQPLKYCSKVYLICPEKASLCFNRVYEQRNSVRVAETLIDDLITVVSRLRSSIQANPGRQHSESAFANLPKAAVGVILAPDMREQDVTALFIKRKKIPGDPWSGQIAFPGGRMKTGESLLQTAKREVLEEIGTNLQNYELLGNLDELPTGNRSVMVSPFVFFASTQFGAAVEPFEIEDHVWIPLSFFSDKRNMQKTQVETLIGSREVDSYPYGTNYVVWGMTLRVVEDLLNRMQ